MSESITFRCPDDLAGLIKSLAQEPGRDKTSVVVGMLRQSFQALPLEERNKLPSVPAIYIVYQHSKLLYIGKTNNLKNRWLAHHRLVQFQQMGFGVYIAWFPCDVEQLDALEDAFIELLEPEFNGQKVMGQILATFRIDKQSWQSFKDLAQREGSNASTVLKELVNWYLQGNRIPSPNELLDNCLTKEREMLDSRLTEIVDERIAEKLDQKLKGLLPQLEELRGKFKAR